MTEPTTRTSVADHRPDGHRHIDNHNRGWALDRPAVTWSGLAASFKR
jgi:hypothetical protein